MNNKNNGLELTRNEARKLNEGIRNTNFGREMSKLGSIFAGYGEGPFAGNFFEKALDAMVPEKWLNHGPAWLHRVHDRGENGHLNMQYIGQPVIIEEIETYEVFGTMYKCRYIGDDHLDGEYVNNGMFTDYHLRQLPEAFTEFKTEDEAREYMDTFGDDWTVAGTKQVDDDGNEVWAVGAWIEPKSKTSE